MSAAVLLAWIIVASVIYNVLENLIDSNAVTVDVNNPLAAFIRVAFAVATAVVALVVLI